MEKMLNQVKQGMKSEVSLFSALHTSIFWKLYSVDSVGVIKTPNKDWLIFMELDIPASLCAFGILSLFS
jgi:hypothetical protein